MTVRALILLFVLVPSTARSESPQSDGPILCAITVAPNVGTVTGTVLRYGDPTRHARVSILGTLCGATTDEQGRYRIVNVPEGARLVAVAAATPEPVFVTSGETREVKPIELHHKLAGTARDTLVLSPWLVRGERLQRVVAGSRCPVHGSRLEERTVKINEGRPRPSSSEDYFGRERLYPFVRNHLLGEFQSWDDAPRYARILCCAECDEAQKASVAAARRRLGQPFQTIDVGQWNDMASGASPADAAVAASSNEKRP